MKRRLCLMVLLVSTWAEADTLRLATGNGYAPFSDESLPQRGLSVELVDAVVHEMGHSADIVFLPWKRGYGETLRGNFMATFPYIRSTDRQADFLFSDPLGTVVNRVFVTRQSRVRFRQVDDLVGRTACNLLGAKHPKALDDLIVQGKVKLESPRELTACFKMLQSGRADFVSINDISGWGAIREAFSTESGFQTIGPPVEMVTQHLIVAKSHPQGAQWLAAFNHALAVLEKKGVAKEIRERHIKAYLDHRP